MVLVEVTITKNGQNYTEVVPTDADSRLKFKTELKAMVQNDEVDMVTFDCENLLKSYYTNEGSSEKNRCFWFIDTFIA
jgi:hypothetical protein